MKLSQKSAFVIATGLGCGYIPKVPGTIGSLFAVFLIWLYPVNSIALLLVTVILFFIGVPTSSIVEKFEGRDSGKIVIDEITGQLLTFVFLPISNLNLMLGFLFFRFFDIIKPFPINKSQKLPGGWGVMIDDVLAAICANVLLRLVLLMVK